MRNLEKIKENINVKIFPIYKAVSWDLLFFYVILFLFLTQVKGINAADVLLAEAIYPIMKFLFLMPLSIFIEKVGKRKSLIFANLINGISVICFMLSSNLIHLIIAQFFSAIAFVIKGVAETNLIYDSLPKDEKRGSRFSKLDGKGGAGYFYLDAISSAISGFLYVVNPYIPLVLSAIGCLVSTFLASKFVEVESESSEKISTRKYIKELKYSFRHMLQSNRLKYLLFYGAILSGLLSAVVSLRSGSLEELGVPEQYFGIIFGIMGLVSGIASRNQGRFHNKFHNKTLAMLALPTTISCILVGLVITLELPYALTLIMVILLFTVQFIAKGPFYTLIRRYLNNFTTASLRGKISSYYNLIESLARSLISLFASLLLRYIDSAGTICIIGCVLTIILILLTDKMKYKVGLKPEEYKKSEIEFLEVK